MKKSQKTLTFGLITFLSLLLVSCFPQKKTSTQVTTSNSTSATKTDNLGTDTLSEEQKTLYALGGMLGSRFKTIKLTEQELSLVAQGLKDAATQENFSLKLEEYAPKVQEFFQKKMTESSGEFKSQGKAYLETFVQQEGATKTNSGMAYKILTEGTGKKPKETDTVKVHYKGTLISGEEFDSSYSRNTPTEFPLNKVIKGWTEGLQLIGEGGKIKLVIPSELAYGDQGAPPKIPGGATLVFEVELLEIVATPKK